MSGSLITPTEALLQVAKQHPFRVAVRSGEQQWSYAALWARVKQIAEKIHDLDESRNPVGLYMGLEIDYVAAAHAIWLSGRTVVFLSTHWTPDVLQVVLQRADVRLVLFGSVEPSAIDGVSAVSTLSFVPSKAPSYIAAPSASEVVEAIPQICSIAPTSGTTGVPKSIVYPMRRSLAVLSEESSTLLKPMDGQWLRGGATFLRPIFEIRRFMFNQTTLYLDASSTVAEQCAALCDELESTRNSQLLRVHFTPSVFRAFVDLVQIRAGGSQLPRGFKRVYWFVIGGETLDVYDLEVARAIFPNATIACNYACSEVGFAGVSQVFIRPTDAIPSVVSFGPTHGCTDLVLLDDSLSVIPQNEQGATGIVGIVTSQSATHYLNNEEATQRMFRPWVGDDMLLYTDDIGCLQADGTISILGRNSGSVDTPSTYSVESKVELLAEAIASEVKLLSESEKAIPINMPLLYSGLNSVTMLRLYFWLQSEFEYDEEMTHLFEEDVTAEVLALEILGDELDVPASPASQATVVEDDVPEMLIGEKAADYPVKVLEDSNDTLDVAPNNRPVSKLIVMQPPIETVPETINNIATHQTLQPSIISALFLSWMTPLLRLGAKRPLVESDLLPLRRGDEASMVERWIDPFWTQLRVWFFDQDRKKPTLLKTIFGAAIHLWFLSGLLWFFSVASGMISPLLLQQIIVAAEAPPAPVGNATALAEWTAAIEANTGGFPLIVDNTYALGGILMAFKLAYTLCGRSSDQLVKRMSLNVKTTLISAVYKKALRLSPESSQKFGKGYIMNLVNVDCESISKAWEMTHQVWSIPMQLIVVTVFLSRLLGISTLASVGVLLFALFLLIMVVPVFMKKAAPWFMRLGDRRLKTIREIFDGIRLVKINGREDHFLNKVEGVRAQQLSWLRQFNIGVASFVIVGQITNTLMPLAAFSLFGHENMGVIPAARVFPALSFFGMLVDPLISLPQLLSTVVIATTSWGRVYSFLLADEKPASSGVAQVSYPDVMTLNRNAISITDGGFSWTALKAVAGDEKSDVPRPLLHDINISIRTGSLTAIVGHVGSGKSSLLSAIIGEMMRVSGEVQVNGSIAYCAQQPWVQTSTIQDNILFGRPVDMKQLQKAIETTCFDSDLETFPHGMATQMTEKGNNLSGGQKARLALSRAVYSDADIYLFDDVLAALDPRVGRKVFNNCIKRALSGKTRLLVTHQLQYLNQVDNIIVVSEGGIVEQGSFEQLVARNGELTRLLSEVDSFSEDSEDSTEKTDKRKSASGAKQQSAPQQPDQVIAVEERNQGAVGAATWWTYLKATGGVTMIVMLLLEIVLLQGSTVILSQWLDWWTQDTFHEKAAAWIGIYDGIGFASIILIVVLNVTILLSTVRASRVFHSKALRSVLRAPIWWFESQPIGRIMNRFSKDIESIDQRLMPQLFQLVSGIGNLVSTLAILAYSTPIMLAFVFPMLIVYWFVLKFYRKSLRELKRLESTGRGPLQSRISETLDGIPTIMAYQRETDFASAVGGLLNLSNRPSFLRTHAEIWITLRMEIMSSSIVFVLAMLAHTKAIGNSTGFALALTNASTLTYTMNLLLKSAANVEAEMNSVERLMAYTQNLPQEDPARLDSDPTEAAWPSRGEIVLRDIDAAYHSRPDKLVLRNVNVTFKAGETVFIVGRTGSGKSTLLSLLLRMIDSSKGSVEIDGRDINSLGLSTLRRGMQVIPQDPFVFSGTIRSSLDFDSKHTDDELWHALELVGMKQFVASQERKLDTVVQDNGANYSVGQRQLLCLAAAILRNPKILLLDEATASIDAGADVFIQQAMRRSCPGATILSVMHRLSDKILEECDKILVMEQGVPIEYASPRELLSRPNSMFSKLMAAARNNH